MRTDALNRRLRFVEPQPFDTGFILRPRDRVIFDAINRHGPLPTNYLYEFTKHIAKDYKECQRRLAKLFNGAGKAGPYLARPPQQFASFAARYQPLIYDLAPASHEFVAGPIYKRTDHFLHRFMGACVSASFELGCRNAGLRYIHRDEIFVHPRCPQGTREAKNPLAIPISGGRSLVPDDLFGIEYPNEGFRFFAVEIDRNTESIARKNLGQNAFERKIQGYLDILKKRTFTAHWGLPHLMVLTVTTNVRHRDNLQDHLTAQNDSKLAGRFVFKAIDGFGSNWRVPAATLDVLSDWTDGFDIAKV